MGATLDKGYGQTWENGKSKRAHRASWELYRGQIPKGIFVLHRCDIPSCVNPEHLFLGTNKDNMQDCKNKKRLKPAIMRGEKHGHSKLKEVEVIAILKDGRQKKEIAKDYGVHASAIGKIKNGKGWKHIPR